MLDSDLFYDLNIEFIKEEGMVYIGTSNSSGAKYECESIEELRKIVHDYIDDYLIPVEKYVTKEEENEKEYE